MNKTTLRILVFALCAVLLAGCGSAGSAADTTPQTTQPVQLPDLQVGYGRVDITPTDSVPLRGYGNTEARMSNSITLPLYATCTAFTDSTGFTVLLYHLDLCRSQAKTMGVARTMISEATGIPYDQVLVTATHTHSAPDLESYLCEKYIPKLQEKMVEAAQLALEDRKEAAISTAVAYPEGLNFIRYYNYTDGTWGSGTLPKGEKRVSHIRDADNELQMIRFDRQGGKSVILVNWQGHPHRDGAADKYNITSDIVGAMGNYVEKEMDCLFAYFTGASGNVNNHSMISGVTTTADYLEHGNALGSYVKAAEFKSVATGPIRLLAKKEPLTTKTNKNAQYEFPVYAFCVGDVAFVTAPYEMFDTSGQYIKDHSPYETTFVCTCANEHWGYLPTQEGFDADSSYEAGITKVAPGSAEHMEKVFEKMLNSIHAQ